MEAVLAFNRAAQFYSMALALGEFDRAHTGVLHQRLANAHASAGRGADAAAAFLRAAEMAESIQLASQHFNTIGLPRRRLVWACLRVRGQGMDARRIPFVTRSGA